MSISLSSTVEDILNLKKTEIQSFLRSVNAKLTGTKHELAQRAYEKLSQVRREGVLVENDGNVSNAENATISSSDVNTPSFEELTAGWTSNLNNMQKIMHTDVENYLINSRHRTVDRKKMSCYRQFIRGYNFHKEGYVHNIMMNNISTENPLCYVRSKCFASMKKEVYTQWILLTKTVPVTIVKASCTCPAGYVCV